MVKVALDMGKFVSLVEAVERLSEFHSDDTIYASEPWSATSDAIIAREREAGGLPANAAEAGMTYFLEISIARDFLEDWIASQEEKPSSAAICQRIIQYAAYDA
jgi:hypothetical protein